MTISRDKIKYITEIQYYKEDNLTYSQYINYTVGVSSVKQKSLYKRINENFYFVFNN